MSSTGQSLLQAALEIQQFFEEKHWQFALIGGLAILRWGKPKTTLDVDGTLLTMFVDDEFYVDGLLARFTSRIPDAKAFAARDKDWADVHSILLRQKECLDMDYIRENLAPLCELKGSPEIMIKLEQLLKTTGF